MNWKDFFYFSQRERRGILLLIAFVSGIFVGKYLFSTHTTEPVEFSVPQETTAPPRSTYQPYSPKYQQQPTSSQPRSNNAQPQQRTYYAPRQETPEARPSANTEQPKQEKFAAGTVIELNAADSLALMHIPGIGASFAKRILSYKKILGGYHRIEQLQEVYGMYEELYEKITPYLTVDAGQTVKIQVNSASLDKLKSHPYINFYQAKAIVETRKKKGKLSEVAELQLLEEFSEDDWIRITPYLDFE